VGKYTKVSIFGDHDVNHGRLIFSNAYGIELLQYAKGGDVEIRVPTKMMDNDRLSMGHVQLFNRNGRFLMIDIVPEINTGSGVTVQYGVNMYGESFEKYASSWEAMKEAYDTTGKLFYDIQSVTFYG
jgi:hypothetical protein